MANLAAVKKSASREPRHTESPISSVGDDGEDLEELLLDALLQARIGNMGAAETFADTLLDAMNALPRESLGGKSTDQAFERLSRVICAEQDEALRRAL